jgi:hypothetical protein
MAKRTISAHAKTSRTAIRIVQPKTHQCSTNTAMVRSSTIGYLMLIGAWHLRQPPRRIA